MDPRFSPTDPWVIFRRNGTLHRFGVPELPPTSGGHIDVLLAALAAFFLIQKGDVNH